jgi:Protein of unknown function (DUF3048) N-terminal domain/Protein of unknown function (DUF3048) C-terminal domain
MMGAVVRRLRLFPAVLVAASLVLAGCGGDDEQPEEDSPQEVAEGSTLDSTWPLTGLPVEGDDSAAQTYPVLVTKIDNTPSSSPQLGLGSADMVVEELVEGGVTRLAVFHYSELPSKVGPVRSMRASDVGIVSPVHAAVVTSGAAAKTIAAIQKAKISFYGEGAAGTYRDNSRSAPYNLFADLTKVPPATREHEEERPDDYLPWGDAKDLPKGKKANTIAANFGNHTTNWKFQGGHYTNLNTFAEKGDEFVADSVLVLRVKVGQAGYRDPAGFPVPETRFEGKGEALLFHDGEVVKATWHKKGLQGPLTLSTKKGDLTVPAGHTWIELVPAANGKVSFK